MNRESPVAVVGIAVRLPGATHYAEYWENLRSGTVSDDIDAVDRFDAAFFGYTAREVQELHPQSRVFLECAWAAIEDAGFDTVRFPGRIGVSAGSAPSAATAADDQLAALTAYALDARGPAVTVQAAGSTSLVAVHLACRSLQVGDSDLVLAGGAAVTTSPSSRIPDGGTRSGVAVVVLRRLADALESRDPIHAVIRGSAVNNDGAARAGFAAPRVDGQADVIAEALSRAGVRPEDIDYLERDGVEFAAIAKAFPNQRSERPGVAGCVKANIGDVRQAAGVAGLVKVALAMQHREVPPDLGVEPSRLDATPFVTAVGLRPWLTVDGSPRRAGVSSFGIGGTNAHVVMEEAPPLTESTPSDGPHVLPLSAKTPDALTAAAARLGSYLDAHPTANLADVAYTLQTGRAVFDFRQVCVAQTMPDAARQVRDAAQRAAPVLVRRRRRAVFMFPGVGAQHVAMASDLYRREAVFARWFDRCAAVLEPEIGVSLIELLTMVPAASAQYGFDLKAMVRGTPASTGWRETRLIQPALFAVELALAQQLMAWGIEPAAVIGHSIGEYTAACIAGILPVDDALRLVAARARLIASLPAGSMLAVALSEEEARAHEDDEISLAAVNGRRSCVLSGASAPIDQLAADLTARGIAGRIVEAQHAFHSRLMAPIVDDLRQLAGTLRLQPPETPCISTFTGDWFTEAEATDPGYWARHLSGTVRFSDGVGRLLRNPEYVLVEVGHGQALASFARQNSRWRPEGADQLVTTLPTDQQNEPDHLRLRRAVGAMWLAGLDVEWEGIHAGADRTRMRLPTYPFDRTRSWRSDGDDVRRRREIAGPAVQPGGSG